MMIFQIGRKGEGSTPAKHAVAIVPIKVIVLTEMKFMEPPDGDGC
jgi:hypothetical protein